MHDGSFRAEDWLVDTISQSTTLDVVRRFHYAQGGSKTAAARHGLFRRGNELVCMGVAQWIPPTRHTAMAVWPHGDWRRVLALSRFALDPSLNGNGAAASYLLGRAIRLIKQGGAWDCLVTYADPLQEHQGIIYRATNWTCTGPTEPERVWVDRHGAQVARKAGGKTRTHAEMLARGHRFLGYHPKLRYVYPLVAHPDDWPANVSTT